MRTNVALEILIQTRPRIGGQIMWMEDHLGQWETLEVSHWMASLFYITVFDARWKEYPSNLRLAVTVDVAQDRIFWNNIKDYGTSGNCFVRSPKWKGLLPIRKLSNEQIHRYKDERATA